MVTEAIRWRADIALEAFDRAVAVENPGEDT